MLGPKYLWLTRAEIKIGCSALNYSIFILLGTREILTKFNKKNEQTISVCSLYIYFHCDFKSST